MSGSYIMVQSAFDHDEFCDLQQILSKYINKKYQAMVFDHIIPFKFLIGDSDWMFLQGNMLIAMQLNPPRKSLKKKRSDVFHSPVEVQILNLSGALSREVYVNNKQFSSM